MRVKVMFIYLIEIGTLFSKEVSQCKFLLMWYIYIFNKTFRKDLTRHAVFGGGAFSQKEQKVLKALRLCSLVEK